MRITYWLQATRRQQLYFAIAAKQPDQLQNLLASYERGSPAAREVMLRELYLGYISAIPRLYLGYISAISRLYLGVPSDE